MQDATLDRPSGEPGKLIRKRRRWGRAFLYAVGTTVPASVLTLLFGGPGFVIGILLVGVAFHEGLTKQEDPQVIAAREAAESAAVDAALQNPQREIAGTAALLVVVTVLAGIFLGPIGFLGAAIVSGGIFGSVVWSIAKAKRRQRRDQ